MRARHDWSEYEGVLPSATELYGIFQPLLGWTSGLAHRRLQRGLRANRDVLWGTLLGRFRPQVSNARGTLREFRVEPGRHGRLELGFGNVNLDSFVAEQINARAIERDAGDPDSWLKAASPDSLKDILERTTEQIAARAEQHQQAAEADHARTAVSSAMNLGQRLATLESQMAGLAGFLAERGQGRLLCDVMHKDDPKHSLMRLIDALQFVAPDRSELLQAVVSPVGILHGFRQYFFELDSFLGPPVQHIWLSPGSSVTLVETSSRREYVERFVEQTLEATTATESTTTQQDELSNAVRQENSSNTRLGVGVDQGFAYGVGPFFSGATTASADFSIESGAKSAREIVHKGLRQQTVKLSSEIRKSYKSSFRTVSERIDTQSKSYVLNNAGGELLNYELRRKMRRVGVQLQDYGTSLCWQTYVDNPGQELGVGLLVHMAQAPALDHLKEPEEVARPEPFIRDAPVALSGQWIWDDETTMKGFVPFIGRLDVTPPKAGYVFDRAECIRVSGENWHYEARPDATSKHSIDLGGGALDDSYGAVLVGVVTGPGGITIDEKPSVTVQVTVIWRVHKDAAAKVAAENQSRIDKFNQERQTLYTEALYKAARDRVKAAASVRSRPFEDLRSEERIVIYRHLVRQLLRVAGLDFPDDKVQHVFAEMVQALFDVDRMLYFVAPEWWAPQPMWLDPPNPQSIGLGEAAADFNAKHVVSWGGASEAARKDNYHVTEDSDPARFGASLGWLLQLDGDNQRNAFLNAPWVKAVLPVRGGKEWDALKWLSNAKLEGAEGLSSPYAAEPGPEREKILQALKAHQFDDAALNARYAGLAAGDLTVQDALHYVIVTLQAKLAMSRTTVADPTVPDLGYLPTDEVYEHGFRPLPGGFVAQADKPFEVFDQWVEVVPTDQIVPVSVAYNPKTGLML